MTITSAIEHVRSAARKDPKKAGVLLLLVTVMGVMWVRALTRQGPAPAAGSMAPDATMAGPTGGSAASNVILPARSSDKSGADWSAVPLMPPARNLFVVDYTRFQKSGNSTAAGAPTQAADNSGSDPSKSGPTPADLKKERQILVANLQAQASQLKLQTIVTGAETKALINGSLVEVGDVVASFRVVRITARGITVEREGIKFDVLMGY